MPSHAASTLEIGVRLGIGLLAYEFFTFG